MRGSNRTTAHMLSDETLANSVRDIASRADRCNADRGDLILSDQQIAVLLQAAKRLHDDPEREALIMGWE